MSDLRKGLHGAQSLTGKAVSILICQKNTPRAIRRGACALVSDKRTRMISSEAGLAPSGSPRCPIVPPKSSFRQT